MMGTTKLGTKASRISIETSVVAASVSALGIQIIGVLLLILGCGPPV